jgi:hypothetical protein
MTNLADATNAYVTSAARLGRFGSDNKRIRAEIDVAPDNPRFEELFLKRNTRMLRMATLRQQLPARGRPMAEIIAYGRTVMTEQMGNCFEYSAAACSILDGIRPAPVFDIVRMPGLDHAFVVVGQSAPDAEGLYPYDFGAWDATAAICDGWGEVCCLAQGYPAAWNTQMDQWALNNIDVPVGAAGSGLWGSPATYRDAVQAERKESYTWQRNNGCCFITTATCLALGLGDTCHELVALRGFRDQVMRRSLIGAAEVAAYYDVAPSIVAALDRRVDSAACYREIYRRFIAPAVAACDAGDFETPHRIFAAAMAELAERYRPEALQELHVRLGV